MAKVVKGAHNCIWILAGAPDVTRIAAFIASSNQIKAHYFTMAKGRANKEAPIRAMLTVLIESPPFIRKAICVIFVVIRT
jgi:hypothetical protein